MAQRKKTVEIVNYEDLVRNFITALIPAVGLDTSTDPVVQEAHQCHQEAREVLERLEADGSSWEHLLDELVAWSQERPCPNLDARKLSMSIRVDKPAVVYDTIERSGVLKSLHLGESQ
jgi:hypothetical protein